MSKLSQFGIESGGGGQHHLSPDVTIEQEAKLMYYSSTNEEYLIVPTRDLFF